VVAGGTGPANRLEDAGLGCVDKRGWMFSDRATDSKSVGWSLATASCKNMIMAVTQTMSGVVKEKVEFTRKKHVKKYEILYWEIRYQMKQKKSVVSRLVVKIVKKLVKQNVKYKITLKQKQEIASLVSLCMLFIE
jgi:hypothetical protein